MTNESFTLEIESPLLRPGIKLIVGPFSKKYAEQVVSEAMDIVREINSPRNLTFAKETFLK